MKRITDCYYDVAPILPELVEGELDEQLTKIFYYDAAPMGLSMGL